MQPFDRGVHFIPIDYQRKVYARRAQRHHVELRFAERNECVPGRSFQRGFEIGPGERVLVVDDVLTTGGSIREVIDAVQANDGVVGGVAVLVDRSAGKTDFGAPFFACLALELPVYDPARCPLCRNGIPLTIT